jgi:hypothetical protein
MPNKRNAALPDWFPLPIYRQVLTKNEWLTEIGLRAALQTAERNMREGKVKAFRTEGPADETFRAMFVTRETRSGGDLAAAQEASFWPVRHPTPFELFFLAENQRVPEHAEAEAWATKLKQKGKPAIAEFVASGSKKKMGQMDLKTLEKDSAAVANYMDVIGKQACLMVDLDYDDQTLELGFKVWLAGIRHLLDEKAPQPIGDKDFAKWTRFGLLPAFDLLFWSRVTNTRYTDAFMAKAVWPDTADVAEFVDTSERFRKVTRPMVEEVFHWNFVQRFWRQMELENTLDVIVERDKASKAEAK